MHRDRTNKLGSTRRGSLLTKTRVPQKRIEPPGVLIAQFPNRVADLQQVVATFLSLETLHCQPVLIGSLSHLLRLSQIRVVRDLVIDLTRIESNDQNRHLSGP